MTTVRYSRWKIAVLVIVLLALAWLGLLAMEYGERRWPALGAAFIFLGVVLSLWGLRYFVSPKVLTMDVRGITHHGLFGSNRAEWRAVESVEAEAEGMVTKLYLRGPFGFFGRCEVIEQMLGGEYRTVGAIVAAMQAAQAGGSRTTRAAAPVHDTSPPQPAPRGFGRRGVS